MLLNKYVDESESIQKIFFFILFSGLFYSLCTHKSVASWAKYVQNKGNYLQR